MSASRENSIEDFFDLLYKGSEKFDDQYFDPRNIFHIFNYLYFFIQLKFN